MPCVVRRLMQPLWGCFCVMALAASLSLPVMAQDWGTMAVVSSTMGATSGKVCVGAAASGRPGDIGCASDAPTVSGGLLTADTLSATTVNGHYASFTTVNGAFVGDGSGLTGVTAAATDRITSGTTQLLVVSNTGYISLTQGGTNTGWFSPYTGLVTLGVSSTGGISGTTGYFGGNVGIGTTNPGYPLVVNGIASFSGLRTPWITGTSGGTTNGIYMTTLGNFVFYNSNTADVANILLSPVVNDYTGASASVRLRSTGDSYFNGGNVGIATTAPQATLQVSGSMIVSTTGQSTTPTLYVGTNGKVGIGTSSPSQTLHLFAVDGSPAIKVGNYASGFSHEYYTQYGHNRMDIDGSQSYTFYNNGYKVLTLHSTGTRIFGSSGATLMTISETGNVGIGTTVPSTSLHVSGTIRISNGGEACDANRAGAIRYNSGSLQYCNGSSWTTLSGGGSADWYAISNIPAQVQEVSNSGAIVMSGVSATNVSVTNNLTASGATISSIGANAIAANSVSSTLVSASNISATYVDATRNGTVSATYGYFGTVSASSYYGDGSNLTGINASQVSGIAADRISTSGVASGASLAMVVADQGTVSFTTGGVAGTSYLDSVGRWIGPGISITTAHGVSSTNGYFSGNVGVGTASPASTFEVSGTAAFQKNNPGVAFLLRGSSGVSQFWTTAGSTGVFISNTIQTGNSTSALGIGGGSAYNAGGNINLYGESHPSTPNIITFRNGTVEAMRINASGNIGVSKTNQLAKLDVNGTISASDAVQVGSSSLACSAGIPGAIRYNSGGLEYCNGSAWSALAAGSGGGYVDRIVSDTTSVIANDGMDSISFTTAGTQRLAIGPGSNIYVSSSVFAQLTSASIAHRVLAGDTDKYAAIISGAYDYATGPSYRSVNMTYYGSSSAGTTLGSVPVANLGTLAFLNTANSAVYTNGSSPLIFGTLSLERMRINAAGNLGISTTSPLAKLDVNGTISASNAVQIGSSSLACSAGIPGAMRYNSGTLEYCNGSAWTNVAASGGGATQDRIVSGTSNVIVNTNGAISFTTAGSERMVVDAIGNVGIGTSNPSSTLHVVASQPYIMTDRSAANTSGFRMRTSAKDRWIIGMDNTAESGSNVGGDMIVYRYNDAGTYLGEALRVQRSNGYVGIGTNLPLYLLDVSGTARVKSYLYLSAGESAGGRLLGTTNGPAVYSADNSLAARFYNGSLVFNGAASFRPDNDVGNYMYVYDKVGISNTSPLAKLDVVGTISASDAVQIGSSSLACSTGIPGAMRYNSGTLEYCNGSAWSTLASAAAAGAVSPTGAIQFSANGSGAFGGDADNLYWDNANKRLGIGNPAPSYPVDISTSGVGMRIATQGATASLGFTFNQVYSSGGPLFLNYSSTENILLGALGNGNTGIGATLNPLAKLDVVGTISSSDAVQVGSSSLACSAGIPGAIRYNSGSLEYCNGSAWSALASSSAASAVSPTGAIQFSADGAGAFGGDVANLYWDNGNKRLGIGTTAPSTTLDVLGDISYRNVGTNAIFSGNTQGIQFEDIGDGSGSALFANAGYLYFYNRATSGNYVSTNLHMTLDPNGKVGIGTTSPQATLQVSGSLIVSTSVQNTTPTLYVGTDGKIGLGTSVPDARLTVAQNGLVEPTFSISSPSVVVQPTHGATNADSLIMLKSSGSSSTFWSWGGFAQEQAAQNYRGTTALTYSATGGVSVADEGFELRQFIPGSTTMTRLRLDGRGYVGISTTVPSSTLHVDGEVQLSSTGTACGSTKAGAIRYTAGVLELCDGSSWSGIGTSTAEGDRIVSGTLAVVANSATSIVSLSTAGTDWGYLGSGLSYLPQVAATRVSSTNVSVTVTGFNASTVSVVGGPGGNFIASGTTSVSASSAGTIKFATAGSQRAVIDSSGNVGIGTQGPAVKFHVDGVGVDNRIRVSAASNTVQSELFANSSYLGGIGAVGTGNSYPFSIRTNDLDRIFIDTSGNVGIGKATPRSRLDVNGTTASNTDDVRIGLDNSYGLRMGYRYVSGYGAIQAVGSAGAIDGYARLSLQPDGGNVGIGMITSGNNKLEVAFNGGGATVAGIALNDTAAAGSGVAFARFQSGGTEIGSIKNSGGSAVVYNTTSDRRVKENIAPSTRGLDVLAKIAVADFDFIQDPSKTRVQGFIAQDLYNAYPEAVSTNGDDGTQPLAAGATPWAVDYGRMTPLLVKSVQELKVQNDTLRVTVEEQGKLLDDMRRELQELRNNK